VVKILKIKNLEEAMSLALKESKHLFESKKNLSICMTGGRFGKEFSKFIVKKKLKIFNKKFFLSDERINCSLSDKNYYLIWAPMKQYNKDNIFYFFQNKKNIINKHTKKNISNFPHHDLCFLSLGEDGHLAGHFENSINFSTKTCFTDKAPKKPFRRVSFRVDWLLRSKKIIIIVLGLPKRNALRTLMNGKSQHSKELKNNANRVTIITDLKINLSRLS